MSMMIKSPCFSQPFVCFRFIAWTAYLYLYVPGKQPQKIPRAPLQSRTFAGKCKFLLHSASNYKDNRTKTQVNFWSVRHHQTPRQGCCLSRWGLLCSLYTASHEGWSCGKVRQCDIVVCYHAVFLIKILQLFLVARPLFSCYTFRRGEVIIFGTKRKIDCKTQVESQNFYLWWCWNTTWLFHLQKMQQRQNKWISGYVLQRGIQDKNLVT